MLSDKELITLDWIGDRKPGVRHAIDLYTYYLNLGDQNAVIVEEYLRRFL